MENVCFKIRIKIIIVDLKLFSKLFYKKRVQIIVLKSPALVYFRDKILKSRKIRLARHVTKKSAFKSVKT